MIEILTKTNSTMQNIYTALPTGMHLGFCVIATLVYGLQFIRKKSPHYILLLVACDLTFITQIYVSYRLLAVLAVLEVGLLIASAVISFMNSRKEKQNESGAKKNSGSGSAVDSAFDD